MGNFPRLTPTRELHVAFRIPYEYDFITKLGRYQADVIQNYENAYARNIGQDKTTHRNHKGLKFGGGQAYYRSSDSCRIPNCCQL